MARLSAARRVALQVLSQCRRRDARVREVLRTSEAMATLDVRDRALASRLALGSVSARGTLDELINASVRRPSSLEPRVRDALRLSTFEVCYLETPQSAAVSQGVELVRSVSPRAAGLANAVLRKVSLEAAPRISEARARCVMGNENECSTDDLALISGLPGWLIGRIRAERGDKAALALALSQLEPAPVYVHANLAKHSADEALALLDEASLNPVATELAGSFELGSPSGLASSGLVDAVDIVVSDLAAQHVAHLAHPLPGQMVLEVGQGRGTKSVLLQSEACASGGFATVFGVDSEPFKVDVASRRMKVAGLSEWVSCHVLDARTLSDDSVPDVLQGPFDLVFVDAPCSGTGTMRRHPEIGWSLGEDALSGEGSLPELQLAILCAAATRVKDGGSLLYATCSVLTEENEAVVEAFLSTSVGASFVRTKTKQTFPAAGGCDGHFCCLMQRQ